MWPFLNKLSNTPENSSVVKKAISVPTTALLSLKRALVWSSIYSFYINNRGGGESWRRGEEKALTAGSGGSAQWESVKIDMTLGREYFVWCLCCKTRHSQLDSVIIKPRSACACQEVPFKIMLKNKTFVLILLLLFKQDSLLKLRIKFVLNLLTCNSKCVLCVVVIIIGV